MPVPVILSQIAKVATTAANASFAIQGMEGAIGSMTKALINTNPVLFAVGAVANVLRGIKGAAQEFVANIGEIVTTLGTLNFPTKLMVQGLDIMMDAVGGVGKEISRFVQLANPVEVQKFNLAMDDLTAVFGKILTPMMQYSTALVRGFADAILSIAKPMQNLMHAVFKPLTDMLPMASRMLERVMQPMGMMIERMAPLARSFGMVAQAIASLSFTVVETSMSTFIGLMEQLSPLFDLVAVALDLLLRGLAWWINKIQGLLSGFSGGMGGASTPRRSSVGEATRPAQISGVEDYGRKAQQAAFSLGKGADPAVDAAVSSASALDKIYDKLREYEAIFNNIPTLIGNVIRGAIPDPTKILEKITPSIPGKDTARDTGRWLDRKLHGSGGLVGAIPPG
jgi:hypothetical protein